MRMLSSVYGNPLVGFVCLAVAVLAVVEETTNPCDSDPCQSDDHHCIPLTDTNFECVCIRNCSDRADVAPIDPCNPNPCERDCQCHESCKHAGGYFCRSDSGFLGKNCSVPIPGLRCEADRMILSVSESFVQEYDMGLKNSFVSIASSLHQHSRFMCEISTPSNGVYEMVIPLPFTACNTTSEETEDGIVFSNQMWFNRHVSNAMFDMPVPAAEFQCSYNRVYKLVTSLKPVVGTPAAVTSKKDIFPTISLCKLANCPAMCPELYRVSGGAFYTVGEMIHVTMSLDSGSMTTGIVDMYLTCSRDPASSSMVDIVDGGCIGKSGLPSLIRSSFVSDTVCVSFQTPRALGCSEFYIHAELQSCEAIYTEKCSSSSNNLRCRSKRTRRSAPQVVVLGPLVILDGSTGQPVIRINGMDEYERDFTQGEILELLNMQDEENHPVSFDTILLIGLGLTAVLFLFLFVPYAYMRYNRKQ